MVIQIQFRYSQLTRLQHSEHRIGQVNTLVHRKGLQSMKTNGWWPDLFIWIHFWNGHSCRNRRDRSPVQLLRGDPAPLHNPSKTTEELHPGTGMSFPPHQPEQVDRKDRLHLKCQLPSLLLWQPLRWKCDLELSVSGRCWKSPDAENILVCWLEWEEPAAFWCYTKPLLVEAEPLHSASPIWLL